MSRQGAAASPGGAAARGVRGGGGGAAPGRGTVRPMRAAKLHVHFHHLAPQFRALFFAHAAQTTARAALAFALHAVAVSQLLALGAREVFAHLAPIFTRHLTPIRSLGDFVEEGPQTRTLRGAHLLPKPNAGNLFGHALGHAAAFRAIGHGAFPGGVDGSAAAEQNDETNILSHRQT